MVALPFIVINTIIGCYAAIRLGYGPPNWQTALNLVVPLTRLQDCLNWCRDWLEAKIPMTTKLFDRLRIPRPIIIVDTTPLEDEDDDEQVEEQMETEEPPGEMPEVPEEPEDDME